jgi:hypothetical protein
LSHGTTIFQLLKNCMLQAHYLPIVRSTAHRIFGFALLLPRYKQLVSMTLPTDYYIGASKVALHRVADRDFHQPTPPK